MDGVAYIQWNLDAREAAGLQPIPYSCKFSYSLVLSLSFPPSLMPIYSRYPLSFHRFSPAPRHHLTPTDPESKAPSKAPKAPNPKKVAGLKDANANADAASVMSTSSFGSHIGLLKEKMKSKSKKESRW